MFYDFAISVPKNTTAAAPLVTNVQLPPGTIHKVDVQFPAGCVGLVRSQAFRGAHQVWPSNDGAYFAANGATLSWEDEYDLADAPFTLRIVAWNLDDFYAHTVTWRFALRNLPPAQQEAALQALYQLVIDTGQGG